MPRPIVYFCFFLSGFSGLLNEIVWSRLFVYTMGSSHHSIAVVVSVFMGGLALGSILGGPIADRSSSPLRLYGGLVLLAGLLCAAVVPLLWLAEPLLGYAYRLNDGEPAHPVFTLVKAVVCALTILLPTTLMGATLPALIRYLTRDLREVGARLGMLYGVNTFGAVAGASAAGFYLIGRIGLGWSVVVAAGIDILVGSGVLLWTAWSRRKETSPAALLSRIAHRRDRIGKEPIPPPAPDRVPAAVRIAILAFGVAGFVNMCLQLGWTRALIISIGNSTYAFSVIVAIFIFGLAAGGWIAGIFADRLKNPILSFGWLLIATAVASGMTIPWLGLSPPRFAYQLAVLVQEGKLDYSRFLLQAAGSVLLVILPPTLLMGMALPLVGKLRVLAPSGVGRGVGSAYAANTIGAILGTAITGFVLLPLLARIWKLLYLAVGIGLLAGLVVVVVAPGKDRGLRFSILGLVVVLCLSLAYVTRPHGVLDSPQENRLYWHPVIFSFGSYAHLRNIMKFPSYREYAHAQVDSFEPLYYRDGEAASVAVVRQRSDNHISLKISGKTDASAGHVSFDIQTQLLMGHLPLLIHQNPRRALNLGLGGGMSLGAMTLYPEVVEIDLLELCPEVEEAARLYFAEANHAALTSQKVLKVIGDGRNHLTHTRRTYDVISSEPSNFWIAGLGNLFTQEFYRLALQRLHPGGIVCQWLYSYNLRLSDYKIALRTFLWTFPHVAVWSNVLGDTILLGSKEPLVFRRERIAQCLAMEKVREDLSIIGIEKPEDLFRYFKCEGSRLRSWVGEGATNSDLYPILEYSSPLGFYDADAGIALALSEAAAAAPWPPELFRGFSTGNLAAIDQKRRQAQILTRLFSRNYVFDLKGAVEEYKMLAREGDAWSLHYAAQQLSEADWSGAIKRKLLRIAREAYDTPELCMADGFRPGPSGDTKNQLEAYRKLAREAPKGRWQPYLALAAIETREKLTDQAFESLEVARERGAPAYKISQVKGILLGMQGDLLKSESLLRSSLSQVPANVPAERGEIAWNLGHCREIQGMFLEAMEAYRSAKEADYHPVNCVIAVARCYRKKGDLDSALKELENVLAEADREGSKSGLVRAEISRLRAAAGDLDQAIRWMQMAAEFSPGEFEGELEGLRSRARSKRK